MPLLAFISSAQHIQFVLKLAGTCVGYATPGGQSDAVASSLAGPQGSPLSQPSSPTTNGDDSPSPFAPPHQHLSRGRASASMQSIVSPSGPSPLPSFPRLFCLSRSLCPGLFCKIPEASLLFHNLASRRHLACLHAMALTAWSAVAWLVM